jgi:hypothetical protein
MIRSYNSFNYKITLHFLIQQGDIWFHGVTTFDSLGRNDYYRMFNLPFAVSILLKTLQVLIVSIPHSILLYIYIFMLYFVGRPRNEVMGSMEQSQICWE